MPSDFKHLDHAGLSKKHTLAERIWEMKKANSEDNFALGRRFWRAKVRSTRVLTHLGSPEIVNLFGALFNSNHSAWW
jgi:hypothetical protein